jgi:hypothetical protein
MMNDKKAAGQLWHERNPNFIDDLRRAIEATMGKPVTIINK